MPARIFDWPLKRCVLTALSDGYFDMPMAHLIQDFPVAEAEALQARARRPLKPRVDVIAFLVRRPGTAPILIDAGMGAGNMRTLGKLPEALADAGVAPADIGSVLLTHLHGDHCGGLIDAAGRPLFPNAELVMARAEAEFWLADGRVARDKTEDWARGLARRAVAPYRDRIRFIDTGAVVEGVESIPLPGHTPGHTGYAVEGDPRVVIWGDLVTLPHVQSAAPDAGMVTDVDVVAAAATRRRFFEDAAEAGTITVGMHTEFPALYQVFREGAAFRLMPAHWAAHG